MSPGGWLWRFPAALIPARFVERPHRFALVCAREADGARLDCHLPDPGRLEGLLRPGARVWVQGPAPPPRKLPWSAALVEAEGAFVSLNPSISNVIFPLLWEAGLWPALAWSPMARLSREVAYEGGRVDFVLEEGASRRLIEVKSVTMRREGGVGAFPDAPSARARRHLEALIGAARRGERPAAVFVGGRGDLGLIEAAGEIDPELAALLAEADEAGVALLGARVWWAPEGARDPAAIPVRAELA